MKKNPVTTLSTSVHVMFWNPICPSIGESKAGKIMMKIPCAIHPIIVPRRPPTWLAKIPAVPPAKKLLITPGKIIGNPSIGVKNIPMIDPIVVKMNPKITAFGAYGNNTGQSKAGCEFGTSVIEMPGKAGTNSAISKRKPDINTYKPVTNCNACKNMNTM